jgi:hypothetical protein
MSINISLFTLDKIKHEAKTLKHQLPHLSYMQRLDLASKETLKVRNYHEAKVRCKKHIDSYITINGSVSECSYCGLSFVESQKDDLKVHESRHLEYEKAEVTLGFLPATYKVRENNKKTAYDTLSPYSKTPATIEMALLLIRTHFDRSLTEAIIHKYWRKHPTFEEYVAMSDDYKNMIPEPITTMIRTKYGRIAGQIESGKSYWYPQD